MDWLSVALVIALALGFTYTNGFHDSANAIATSVTTRTLTLACQDTSAWPVARLLLDVQFTSPAGEVRSTSTVQIYSIRDITHA